MSRIQTIGHMVFVLCVGLFIAAVAFLALAVLRHFAHVLDDYSLVRPMAAMVEVLRKATLVAVVVALVLLTKFRSTVAYPLLAGLVLGLLASVIWWFLYPEALFHSVSVSQ